MLFSSFCQHFCYFRIGRGKLLLNEPSVLIHLFLISPVSCVTVHFFYYAVGYATAKNPLGPFAKSNDNPVLQKNVEQGGIVTGTGHNSVTWSKDGKQMYCVYHGYTQKTGSERVVFIDKMGIDENGKLYVDGPNAE